MEINMSKKKPNNQHLIPGYDPGPAPEMLCNYQKSTESEMIKKYINQDVDRLSMDKLSKVYKFIRVLMVDVD